jgi:hypothetical protein
MMSALVTLVDLSRSYTAQPQPTVGPASARPRQDAPLPLRLPLQELSPARQAIIICLVTLARRLDMTVIAEGIEIEAELPTLRAAGIRLFQGYLFAKPALAWLPDVSFAASGAVPQGLMLRIKVA